MRTYLIWLRLPEEYGKLHCTLMQRFETMATPDELKPELDTLFARHTAAVRSANHVRG